MNPIIFASVLLLAASAAAQFRPFYAGNGFQYPRPINSGGDDGTDGLGNRGSFDSVTSRTDVFGHDTKVVENANNYPEDRKPFWLLNRDHIAAHIGLDAQGRPVQRPGAVAPQRAAPAVDVVQPLDAVVDPATNVA